MKDESCVRRLRWVGLALALACSAGVWSADGSPVSWPKVGFNDAETRDSPLRQITAANVRALAPAWFADLTSVSQRAFEATPLVVDGTLYIVTAWSVALAFDATTGRELWRYDPHIDKSVGIKGCCGPASRGLAYAAGKIFLAAFDGRLVALDAHSGRALWTTATVDHVQDYTITGAPRIIGNLVIIGNGGAEYGVRGYVTAYDIANGILQWRFYTVPPKPGTHDGAASDSILEKMASSWAGEWWKLGGGGTVWDSMAYDPELDLLYIGVGNGGPWNRQMRSAGKGDNLFLSSIVALRPKTGEYVWHFQTTPGDEWDYTASQSIILANMTIAGVVRKVLLQAPKNGFFYVLDRETGGFISGTPFVDVTWAKGLDATSGRPIENPSSRYSENARPSIQAPGPLGGHNWQPMSFSAATGLVYIPALQAGFKFVAADKAYEFHRGAPNMGIDPVATGLPQDSAGLEAARQSIYGELIAWDPLARKAAWRVRHDVAWNGGTLVTAGGLVFQGDASGDLVAYSATRGDRLWSINLGAGIVAAPMTYSIAGEQYLAVAVGWGGGLVQVAGAMASHANHSGINRLVVLKLNGTAVLPVVVSSAPRLAPPPSSGTSATVAAGRSVYERRCYVCHGGGAISGGEVPDLRFSAALKNPDSFRQIVLEGSLAAGGMPGFAHDLVSADADAIRDYIIERANASLRQDTPPKTRQ